MTDTAAPPVSASTDTSFMADAVRLVRVLFSPGAVFGEIQNRPTFWRPWILVSIVSVIITYLQRPFQQRVQSIIMEHAGRPMPADTPLKMVLALCASPIVVLVLMAISAVILYGLASAMGGEVTYKKMLSVVAFSFPPILIQQIITVAVLMTRGVQSISGPADMFVSLGADLALPADASVGYFTRFVLAGIGPLQIWALVIVAIGVMVMGKTSKGSAWTAAIIHFIILLVAFSALGALGAGMMGGATK